jgi:glycosyltransferase involved in cell wall biosynthesis
VTVVIAAYRESAGIGGVLDRIPAYTCDAYGNDKLEVATIVVVDGDTDDTAAIARERGAYTAVLPRNRGQGAALRLGYCLARRGGTEFIVTTDADGQYDIDQMPQLLQPLRTGEADFVTGSRRLGKDESRDPVRRTGVRFFASLVRLLTGYKVTDTSFGLRAMRAGVTGAVTLEQPQYQASELLIGVLMNNFEVVEVPATMRARGAGKSKKGNNLVYGWRYARVVLRTWRREWLARRHRSRLGSARFARVRAEHEAV